MRPYQVHLFSDETKALKVRPVEPVFIYEDKRYLNFASTNCRHLYNNEHLKETAKLTIDEKGLIPADGETQLLAQLKKRMENFKKVDSLMVFPDEISAFFALITIFSDQATFFVDHETSTSIAAVLQGRNTEYYSHRDLDHLGKLLGAHSVCVLVVDGLYEWLGCIAPVPDLIKIAKQNGAIVVANELTSFGLLGRDGRGFIDLFNVYDDVNAEIGSFRQIIGGFGTYVGAKKYLINQIEENIAYYREDMPSFMLNVNLTGLDLIKNEKANKGVFQKLWSNSRYAINRLKQVGFKTRSDTPIIVIQMSNDEEAGEFSSRLFDEGIITERSRERIRLTLSVEHVKADLDFCLDRCEVVAKQLGLSTQPVA